MIAMMEGTTDRRAGPGKPLTDAVKARRTKAVGYVRVSTEEQADSGLGLEAQRAAIASAASRMGLEIVDWYSDEGVSGGTIEGRTGLLAAIDAIKRGYVLLVARRDRLARDAMLACWVEKEISRRYGTIVSVAGEGTDNDDPTSILMRRIIDAFAEYERLLIGVRTKAALRVKARRGERVGRYAHYGYRLDSAGGLVANEHEKDAIGLMIRLRGEGRSLGRIARDLEKSGHMARNGRRLSAKVIRDILRRESA